VRSPSNILQRLESDARPANAVARLDTLEFLSDVVPRTTTFKQYTEERGEDYVPGSDLQAPTPEALKAMREEQAAAEAESAVAGPSRQPRVVFELDQQQASAAHAPPQQHHHQQHQQQQLRPMVSLPPPPGMVEHMHMQQQQQAAERRRRQSMEDPMQLDPRRGSLEVAAPPPHASPVRQQLPFELSGVDRIRVVLPPPTPTILPPEYRR
jgi:hypothetical protein